MPVRLRVRVLRFRVQGSGFIGFRVWPVRFRVRVLRFRVQGSGFIGFRV